MKTQNISITQAHSIVSDNDYVDLDHLFSIPPDIASVVVETKGDLHLSGLRKISEELATILAQHKGPRLFLNGLHEISDAAAALLSNHPEKIMVATIYDNLNSTKCLTPGLARLLVKDTRGVPEFPDTIEIGSKTVIELLKFQCDFNLKKLPRLPAKGLHMLSDHEGEIVIRDEIEDPSNDVFEALVRHPGNVTIKNQTTPKINRTYETVDSFGEQVERVRKAWRQRERWWQKQEAFSSQCAQIPELELDELDTSFRFTIHQIRMLGIRESKLDASIDTESRRLVFGGTVLSTLVSQLVAKYEGPAYLDKVNAASLEHATNLSMHQGFLSLNGIEDVDPDICAILANHDGDICLDGLKDLSNESLSELLKLNRKISLGGVESLTDKSCQMIYEFISTPGPREKGLFFEKLVDISDKSADVLISAIKQMSKFPDSGIEFNIKDLSEGISQRAELSSALLELRITILQSRRANYQECTRLKLSNYLNIPEDIIKFLNTEFTFYHLREDEQKIILDVDFKEITQLSESMAKRLSLLKGKVGLNNLACISPECARILGKSNGRYSLDSVKHLSLDAALGLSECTYLSLGGIEAISEDVARGLLDGKCEIDFRGLKEISFEVAEVFAAKMSVKNRHIEFSNIETISGESIKAFIKSDIFLRLPRLKEIPREYGWYIEEGVGAEFEFTKIEEITEKFASSFRLFWDLRFPKVKALTARVAELLVNTRTQDESCPDEMHCKIHLPGLKDLPAPVAETMADNWPEDLALNELPKISSGTAGALSRHNGNLSLSGLLNVSDSAARQLGSHRGTLVLDGLEELSPEAAEALGHHQGNLYLNGLSEISKNVALGLIKQNGSIFLGGIKELLPEVAEALARAPHALIFPDLRGFSNGIEFLYFDNNKYGRRKLYLSRRWSEASSTRSWRRSDTDEIIFKGVSKISIEVANALKDHQGEMMLRCFPCTETRVI